VLSCRFRKPFRVARGSDMRRVLVLEANDALRLDLLLGLRRHEIDAEAVESVLQAASTLAAGRADVVLLGPGGGTVRDLRAAIFVSPCPVDVVALVDADPRRGLVAIEEGASDFVPLAQGADGLALALRKIEARRAHAVATARAAARATAKDPGGSRDPFAGRSAGAAAASVRTASGEIGPDTAGSAGAPVIQEPPVMVGESPKIAAVLAMVRRLAGVRSGVLVGGESGTGKELIAQALHDQSPWRGGPFVAVNCGAIPSGLIESELFGHVRGSFTDAVRDKTGLFEAAHGGTLFLDEIADLPLGLQPKLLRAVQDGVIRRVGDVDDLRVEVRVVAATARDLSAEVRAGRFREDLYYRLAGLCISLPPLRDRREDIPLLAVHFLANARARIGRPVNDIDPEALRLLVAYPWPGNVRELENTIERAAVLCSGDRIDPASLPERMVPADPLPAAQADRISGGRDPADLADLSIKRASRRSEEDLIGRALVVTDGNRTRAAELLEISHRALLYKIKEYGIVVGRGSRGPAIKT
jgi:DNA-binding NtrC family response regulator